jgi:hypothetical protein
VFIGGRLDDAQALQAANQVVEDLNALIPGGRVPGLHGCRRVTARRVDCPDESLDLCQGVIAVELHDDGLPYLHEYSGGLARHCHFHRHPHWSRRAYPARPL